MLIADPLQRERLSDIRVAEPARKLRLGEPPPSRALARAGTRRDALQRDVPRELAGTDPLEIPGFSGQ